MSKFHINKNGVPAPCKAKEGNCPLGGSESHFTTKEEAQVFLDKQAREKYGLLAETEDDFEDLGPSGDYYVNVKLREVSERLGKREVLDSVAKSMGKDNIVELTEDLVKKWGIEDQIDMHYPSYERFSQVVNNIGEDNVFYEMNNFLGDKEFYKTLNDIDISSEKEYIEEIPKDNEGRLRRLSSMVGADFIAEEISRTMSIDELKLFNNHASKEFGVPIKKKGDPEENFKIISKEMEEIAEFTTMRSLESFLGKDRISAVATNLENVVRDIYPLLKK